MAASSLITILFTDLVGSTELTSRIGDVAADELRRLHFEDLRDAVAATGGTEVKTIGDALMVSYTGAADALNGAVEMQRAVDRRNRRAAGQELQMRVGVSAGDAAFEDDDWFGTPVVEAARLCAAAEAGQILISDLVKALAGSRVQHEAVPLGQRELKGLAAPVNVSEITWQAASDATGVPLPGFVDTAPTFPFAGRAAEREELVRLWKESLESHRRVAMISGEPGIGKTRLVTEFVRTAHDQGGVVLWGRCDEALDVTYQPFAEALGLYVASIDEDRLAAEVMPRGAEIAKLVPELAQRVSGVAEAPAGEADAERHRLFEAVADVLGAMAATDPVVLVLDDIHWADKPSLLLLRHLLRRPQPIRLFVLATYRDTDLDRSHPLADVLADLRRESGVERIDLQGLDQDEVTSFMEAAAGHELEESAHELAAAIHRETEGNPFFLGEMIRHLAESGYIVQRDGRWVSDYELADVGIPEGIREVVGRRLSNLSQGVNEVLSVAAVIGPEFDVSTLTAVTGTGEDDLFDLLDAAAGAGVVREVKGAFGRYSFGHALVRSTLYEELSTNRRVRLHWRIGETLAAREGRGRDRLDQIAHHLAEGALAGDAALAVEYCRRAGDRAMSDLAFEAAMRSYDRALGAMELLDEPDGTVRCDIDIARCEALRVTSDEAFREVGFAAAAIARELGDGKRLAEAATAMTSGTTTRSGNIDDELVELLREAAACVPDDEPALRARVLAGLAVELLWGPHHEERLAAARAAIDLARVAGDSSALAIVLSSAWVLFDGRTPFIDEMRGYCEEALHAAQPNSATWMWAKRGLVAAHLAHGELDAARAAHEQFVAAAEASRLGRFSWVAMNDRALIESYVGELPQSDEHAGAALAYAQQVGIADDVALGWYGALLFMTRRSQGRLGELIPVLEGLVETQPGAVVWRIALAGALLLADRVEECRVHYEWLVADDLTRIPQDVEYPVTICGLARMAPYVDASADLCRVLYEILVPFAGTFNFTGPSFSDPNDVGLACAAEVMGDHDLADRHFQDAIAFCERSGAIGYLAHCHTDYARALARRGDTDAARHHALATLAVTEGRDMDGPDGFARMARDLLTALDTGGPLP